MNSESWRKYRGSPRGKYLAHKANARYRRIPFDLTFEEWWALWEQSGQWENRSESGYHMCRIEDEGPYAQGNVYIGLKPQNTADRNRSYAKRRRALA